MIPLRVRSLVLTLAVAAGVAVVAEAQPGAELPPLRSVSMVRKVSPVYPFEQLIKGKTGWAEVRFVVDYSGKAVMATISSSSNPAFGHALLADIESNEFMPPRVNGAPQVTLAGQRFNFDENALDPSEKRVIAELRKPMPAIVPMAELDKPLAPARREPPIFPPALQADGANGRAEIEFIVDRDGRAMLPRIVNASHEDFGWTAATAITRWRYQPPTKGGQKVDARATVVVTFDAATSSAKF